MWQGQREQAHKAATAAYKVLDKLLQSNLKYDAIYVTRLALALAILGRITEARSVLASARALPLCESCSYCSCKDADIYEAYIEELDGNMPRALELLQKGQQKWPDEPEFTAALRRLQRNK
jgi:hypothetical protein